MHATCRLAVLACCSQPSSCPCSRASSTLAGSTATVQVTLRALGLLSAPVRAVALPRLVRLVGARAATRAQPLYLTMSVQHPLNKFRTTIVHAERELMQRGWAQGHYNGSGGRIMAPPLLAAYAQLLVALLPAARAEENTLAQSSGGQAGRYARRWDGWQDEYCMHLLSVLLAL